MALREAQTATTLANEVSMLRASMTGAILVVEGVTDVRLYKKFTLPTPHSRTVFADGKPLLLEAMRILEKRQTEGVLGICDADFDRVLGLETQSSVVSADYHDAEMMIANSDAFEPILAEMLVEPIGSTSARQVRDSLMAIAARIGRIRLWNRENDARLTFRGISAGAFLAEDFTFDLDGYISRVLENGPSRQGDRATLLSAADTGYTQAPSGEMAVGHDFTSLLNSYLEIQNPGVAPGPEVLEKFFRLTFDVLSFRKTDLSRKIMAWEENTSFEVLIEDARPV